jgi:hypothetical protein
MCGSSLLAEGSPSAPVRVGSQAQASRDSPARTATAPRTTNTAPEQVPPITGPSFLGLGQPAPSKSGRGPNLKHDHHLSRSGSLDYLLDDDEEPKGGVGRVLLLLVVLLLALGFGYLKWRSGGLAWVTAMAKRVTTSQTVESSPPADSASAPDQTAPPNSPGAASNAAPAPDGSSTNASSGAPQSGPASSPSQPAADSSAANTNAGTGNSAKNAPAGSDANQPSSPPVTPPATPESASGKDAGGAETVAASPAAASKDEAPKPEATPVPAKPSRTRIAAKPSPTKSFDQVTEAERYIYARGERQDCDRGIRMLRPAAEKSNPKAMISLGALYATGVCVPRDLPTAYRWFALALRKQPDNEPLQENLNRLWAQMTQPERQLAIKLSQ